MKQNKAVPRVNITIPVLNEEDTLESKISILQSYIKKQLTNKASVSINPLLVNLLNSDIST